METLQDNIKRLKEEEDMMITSNTNGAALRSQCQFYEEGDRNSKFFLNLEKHQARKKSISKLRTEEGNLIDTQQDILKEEERYYKKLYSSSLQENNEEQRQIEKDIFSTNEVKVDEDLHSKLVEPIGEEELKKIIMKSPKGKSPGVDGYTTEFYQFFWHTLKKHMIKAFNESLTEGSLCTSQKRGIISLIPKPNKDPELLKNWRPITLLNQDYKYLAKCLADRCQDIIPRIVSTDQSGFVNGRYIGTNILRTQNLIDYCTKYRINGCLVNIDFEKAFDSIEWKFIWKALEYFNFPKQFIQWIAALYNGIETCVMNNGHMSKFFSPELGVRQ